MTNDNLCPRCQGGPETLLHMLRDCDEVQSFWQSVVHLDHLSRFFSLGTCSWLDWNMTEKYVGRIQLDWQLFFRVAVYELWRDRNSLAFSQESKLGSHLLVVTMQQAYFIQQYRSPSAGDTALVARRLMQVVWKPLDPSWFKVNVDGSHWRSSSSTACGGLVRNEHGGFVAGFYTKLGSSTALWAELWALRLGIKLARQLHLHSVCFELDSEVVMRMVQTGKTSNLFMQPLLQEVISILHQQDWRTSVIHTYRETSRGADLLANKGHSAAGFDWVVVD